MTDTIFALATAPGRAAVAIVRVSGPQAAEVLGSICGALPPPRQASLRSIYNTSKELLDRALVLWFPAPHSFTGDPSFELQVHGGRAVTAEISDTLQTLGVRAAEPGEFTRRAFEAGKLDLSQAEAIADLVDADTAAQRRQALSQLGGAQIRQGELWRSMLVEALANLEAQIDFADEEIPPDVQVRGRELLLGLTAALDQSLADQRGEQVREGIRIALVGSPNAGKSSLLNCLARRDAAIVTPIAGTTRDVIEVELDLKGYRIILADTAGIRDGQDPIEQEGIRRAMAWAEAADLRLLIVDGRRVDTVDPAVMQLGRQGDIQVLTRQDLVHGDFPTTAVLQPHQVWTSVNDEESIDALRNILGEWVVNSMAGAEFPAVTRARHRHLIAEMRQHLERALARDHHDVELVAEDVRLASRALARLAGRIGAEDVLDRVFSTFCIGK